MPDLDLACFSAGSYLEPAEMPCDNWKDLRVCYAELNGALVVIPRGTLEKSPANLLRDAVAWPSSLRDHPELGRCHSGFLDGAEGLWPFIEARIKPGQALIFTGHSLGAALAILLAAIAIKRGYRVLLLVTWEAPRVGGPTLRAIFDGYDVRQYRFGDDPITDVPWLPELPWEPDLYEHIREPLIAIGAALVPSLDCHFIEGIVAWLTLHPPLN